MGNAVSYSIKPMHQSISREAQLLIELCRPPMADVTRPGVHALLREHIDWPVFLDWAGQWGVQQVAFGNLLAVENAAVPKQVIEEVTARRHASRTGSLVLTLLMLDLVDALKETGVAVIILKGPATALAAYGDPTLRSFADIDLLVHKEHLQRVKDVLLERGYLAAYEPSAEPWLLKGAKPLEFSNGRLPVDLHWTLFPRYQRLDFDMKQIWADSVTIPCLQSQIEVLSPPHNFVFLCGHGAKHRWYQFQSVCDLARVEACLSPAEVAETLSVASALNARRLVSLGIRIVRDVFGEGDSRFDDASLSPDVATRRLVTEARRFRVTGVLSSGLLTRIHPSLDYLSFWIAARERLRDRIGSISSLLLSSSPGDASAGPFHSLWRPIRLASGFFRRTLSPKPKAMS